MLSFAEIMRIIVWHNWNKRVFPSKNDTSYFRLYHYYTYYVTIISIMRIICIISTYLCLLPAIKWLFTKTATAWLGCTPRTSCSRRIDDEWLARPVKDTDLLLLRSAHPVPREYFILRWQSMALRVANSQVQWAHLNPRPCGAFLTRRLSSWPASCISWKQGRSLPGPASGRFLGQLAG